MFAWTIGAVRVFGPSGCVLPARRGSFGGIDTAFGPVAYREYLEWSIDNQTIARSRFVPS